MPDPGVREPVANLTTNFVSQFGAIPGTVKKVYVGKDSNGLPVYKFTYQVRKSSGTIAATRSARPGLTLTRNTTLAVTPNGRFVRAGAAIGRGEVAGADDVTFRPDLRRSDLLDRATAKVGDLLARGLINDEQAKTLIDGFGSWNDNALTRWISRAGTGNRPGFGSVTEVEPEEEIFGDDFFGGIGGGGGGGGGFAGPVYRAPDRRVVEDYVKGTLVSLVGTVPEHLVGPAVDKFMQDHKRNFNSETQEIDPQASVEELIRGTQEYQTIHKLRPKSEDERQWISQRASEAQRGGLDTGQIEAFAINQAATGGDLPDVARAAGVAQLQRSGQAPPILDNQFRQVAQDMFRGVAV